MSVESIRTSTAEEFLSLMRPSHPYWLGNDGTKVDWVFRGQHNSEWELRPSAMRASSGLLKGYEKRITELIEIDRFVEYLKETPPFSDCIVTFSVPSERIERVIYEALLHSYLVKDFALLADQARHHIVIQRPLWDLNFKEPDKLFYYLNGGQLDYVFGIAQHHSIPTILLDLTYNPLIAAFFAAESSIPLDPLTQLADSPEMIAVWALRKDVLDEQTKLSRLTVPNRTIENLDAQEGLFVWSRECYQDYLMTGRFPSFKELLPNVGEISKRTGKPFPYPLLRKITLPHSEAPRLLQMLWREKINPAFLMPTYDHVARGLKLKLEMQMLDGL